jgi:hypothetical protein
MSAKDGFETNLLRHIFQNANIVNVGDSTGLRGSSSAGSLYVALYTVAPSDSSEGTECTTSNYGGYARVAVARSTAGWAVSGNNASNASAIVFPQCTGNSCTVAGFAIHTASTGTGNQIIWGTLSPTLSVSNGITPQFAAGAMDIFLD